MSGGERGSGLKSKVTSFVTFDFRPDPFQYHSRYESACGCQRGSALCQLFTGVADLPDSNCAKGTVFDGSDPAGRVHAVSPPAGCVDLSGFYDVRYEGGCPNSGYLTSWELRQNGCSFSANANPDVPSVRGSVTRSTVKLSLRNGFVACTYTLDGTGTVSNGVIRATVTGTTDGPCCGSRSDTVSLVATRR